MSLVERRCPTCNSGEGKGHSRYTIQSGETRWIYHCAECGSYFSETHPPFLEGLRTPLSRIAMIPDALNNGMGINAACRVFKVSKNTLYSWVDRIGSLKETLLWDALCHQFLVPLIEGAELYTRVHENKPPEESEGWTVVLMERGGTSLWSLSVRPLARRAPHRQGGSSSDAPKKRVNVRMKNKGSQKHQRGPKRPKGQAPLKEHPQTPQPLQRQDIPANPPEAFNSALRRLLSCYRRRTNPYAKHQAALQRRLDASWEVHTFVRPHVTPQQVPAGALGILEKGFSLGELLTIQRIEPPTN